MKNARRILITALGTVAAGLPVSWSVPALAQPSAAAVAKRPENRGRVVGAACEYGDGYVADYSALEGRAQAALRAQGGPPRPVNLVAHADATARLPLGTHELPPGRPYCLRSSDFPNGYLTMNCKVNGDCPGGAICQGGICRAECRDDSDCNAPTVCTKLAEATERRYCRCDACVTKLPTESVRPADVTQGSNVNVKDTGKPRPGKVASKPRASSAK